jgi:hypothetical protein
MLDKIDSNLVVVLWDANHILKSWGLPTILGIKRFHMIVPSHPYGFAFMKKLVPWFCIPLG